MKKFLKSLSLICLAIMLLCPTLLAGCSMNYNIKIEIIGAENSGFVYLKDVEGVSVVGDNTVSSGEKFEYFVVPSTGYQIEKILVDGVPQEDFDVNETYLYFDNVKKDHDVKVYFEPKTYTVNFYCMGDGGLFKPYSSVPVKYGSSLNLNLATYGGETALWFVMNGIDRIYIYNGSTNPEASIPENYEDSNLFFVYGNANIYCTKTEAELESMGVSI